MLRNLELLWQNVKLVSAICEKNPFLKFFPFIRVWQIFVISQISKSLEMQFKSENSTILKCWISSKSIGKISVAYSIIGVSFCRTLWRSDHEVGLSSPPTTTHHPPTTHPPTTLSSEIGSVSLWQAHALKPIHFLKAHVNSYSSTAMEHKYKDKDNYKYKDKDGDAKTITGILTVCYIFGILMTRQVQPSTAQYSLEPPCTV